MSFISTFFENFVTIILYAGIIGIVVGFVLDFIPFVKPYKIAVQVLSILAVCYGLYQEGRISNEHEWKVKLAEMKVKLAEAEARAAENNVEIQTEYVTQVHTIHEKGDEIIKYIDRLVTQDVEVIKYIENCPIPHVLIDQHNNAALMIKVIGDKK